MLCYSVANAKTQSTGTLWEHCDSFQHLPRGKRTPWKWKYNIKTYMSYWKHARVIGKRRPAKVLGSLKTIWELIAKAKNISPAYWLFIILNSWSRQVRFAKTLVCGTIRKESWKTEKNFWFKDDRWTFRRFNNMQSNSY